MARVVAGSSPVVPPNNPKENTMTIIDILILLAFLSYATWNEVSKRKGKPSVIVIEPKDDDDEHEKEDGLITP